MALSDSRDLYARRRSRVLDALGGHAAMILPAAPELRSGRDLELRYRPDADLYYLTGYAEPETVLVLSPSLDHAPVTLFTRDRDPAQELWTGMRGGPAVAAEATGVDAAHPVAELPDRLPSLLGGADTIHFRLGTGREDVERLVREILIRARLGRQRKGRGPRGLLDPGVILDDMRLVKEPEEIALLREAARITVEGFHEAAPQIRRGAGEWEVEAALEAAFRRRGAEGFAFQTIVASGPNATVLHYVANDRRMQSGELLLVDAGASHRMYNGDITRTFPVSGRFSAEQRAFYDAVLAAQKAAIEEVRPGSTVAAVHRAALRSLLTGLVERGLLQGELDDLEGREDEYKPYFPHRTSHWLGLDVHDVGEYVRDGEPRPLERGMVLTVEPGLYIPPGHEGAPEPLRGLGIRIEDDVLVTESGREVLTAALPTDPEAVEALLQPR